MSSLTVLISLLAVEVSHFIWEEVSSTALTDSSGLGKHLCLANIFPFSGFHAWLFGESPCCPHISDMLQVPHLKEVRWAAIVRYGDLLLPLSAGGESSIKLRHFSSETQNQRKALVHKTMQGT